MLNLRRVNMGISANSASLPAGTIIDHAGVTAPAGFLACPLIATNISRATYAALFLAIGTTWGVGDGATTFGIPFFAADQVGIQANANVGTNSVGAVISHSHTGLASTSPVGAYAGAGGNMGNTTAIGTTGGTANLAAGQRILKCVKI